MGKMLKKRLAMVMAVAMLTATVPQATFANDYANHWANAAITKWEARGLLKGYEDGTFKPKKTITRGEFAQILCRLFGLEQTEKAKTYTDVANDKWYAEAIALVSDAGLMYEVEGTTTFRPNDAITREEAAYALATAYKVAGETELTFGDTSSIANWSTEAVEAMVAHGYIQGDNKGYFNPKGTLTRAELVTMVDNMTVDVVSEAGTYSKDVAGNLIVNTRDVVLKDMVIEGNLYLAEGIGDGDVYLENIEVKGQVIVEGGGENSIKSIGSKYSEKFVVSAENPVRIVVEGDAVRIEAMPGTEITLTGNFENVILPPDVILNVKDATVEIILVAPSKDPSVEVKAPVINVDASAKVGNIQADSAVDIKGQGKVDKLVVNAPDVKIEQKPGNVEVVDKDITVNIGGKDETKGSIGSGSSADKPDSDSGSNNGSNSGSDSGGNQGHVHDTSKRVLVSGRVMHEGKAFADARVNIWNKGTGQGVGWIRTDENGYYQAYVPACTAYGAEAWSITEEGYGYIQSNVAFTPHKNETINFELKQGPVVNFKVEDRDGNPIPNIDIHIKGGYWNSGSNTNYKGEASFFVAPEVEYSFRVMIGDTVQYEEKVVLASDELKKDKLVKLEEVGLERIMSGTVMNEVTGEMMSGVKVDIYERNYNNTSHVTTVTSRENGEFVFEINDFSKNYVAEVHVKGEDGKYYASEEVDIRFLERQPLKVRQAYGVEITVVDQNDRPIPYARVGVEYQHGYSYIDADERGQRDIFNYYMEPGNYTVSAALPGENAKAVTQDLTMVEGTYNYQVKFVFESEDAIIEIKDLPATIQVGDAEIPVVRVGLHGKEWSTDGTIRDGGVTLRVPSEHIGESAELVVYGPEGERLYVDRSYQIKKGIQVVELNLINSNTHSLAGTIYLEGVVCTTPASISIMLPGYNDNLLKYVTEVGYIETTDGTFEQTGLVETSYLVRTQMTTSGALYISTDRFYAQSDRTERIDLLPEVEVEVEVVDEQGRPMPQFMFEVMYGKQGSSTVYYTVKADIYGVAVFKDGLEDGMKLTLRPVYQNGTPYEVISGEAVEINGNKVKTTFVVRPKK